MRNNYDFSKGMRNKYGARFKKEKKRYERIAFNTLKYKTVDLLFSCVSARDFHENIEGIVDQYLALIAGFA